MTKLLRKDWLGTTFDRALLKSPLRKYLSPERSIGVTGTNGKTSVVWFIHHLLERLGEPVSSVANATLLGPVSRKLDNTTPSSREYARILRQADRAGSRFFATEASSHGLALGRLSPVRFTTAVFTNLSRDHLDLHGTMSAYADTKAELFTRYLTADGVALLNADDAFTAELRQRIEATGRRLATYGRAEDADYRIVDNRQVDGGQRLSLTYQGQQYDLSLNMIGDFLAENLVAALAVLNIEGFALSDLVPLVQTLTPPTGRLTKVACCPNGAQVYLDYAHNGAGLARALQAIRPHVQGQVFVIISSGGERDPGVRSLIGQAAQEHADEVTITTSVVRTEDPDKIRQSILEHCPKATVEPDRAAAVAEALQRLQPGDALLITERAHETDLWTPEGVIQKSDQDLVDDGIAKLRAGCADVISTTTEFYDVVAGSYHHTQASWQDWVEDNAAFFQTYLPQIDADASVQIIDVAAGVGAQVIALDQIGHKVWASDISRQSLDLIPEATVQGTFVSSWDALPQKVVQPSGGFDLAIAMDNALAHTADMADLRSALLGIKAILNPAGRILFSLRDYDKILAEKPVRHGSEADRARGYWQEWRWIDDTRYESTWYVEGKPVSQVFSRAIPQAEIRQVAEELDAELRAVDGYFQPTYELRWP